MKRMIAVLLAIFIVMAIGCSDKKGVPSGILSREKMETVLWDIIQADQYSADLAKDSAAHPDLKTERLRLYDQVFRLHDVSREEFRKSYQYYSDHPELSQTLFDSLLARGNRLRSEEYAHPVHASPRPLITTPPPLRDSLHRIPHHFPLTPPFNRPSPIPPGKHPSSTQQPNLKMV